MCFICFATKELEIISKNAYVPKNLPGQNKQHQQVFDS